MLLPSPKPKPEVRTQLDTDEQVRRSIRRDKALTKTAKRRQEEQVVERGALDIAKKRVLLIACSAFLAVLLITLVAGILTCFVEPGVAPTLLSAVSGSSLFTFLGIWVRWG